MTELEVVESNKKMFIAPYLLNHCVDGQPHHYVVSTKSCEEDTIMEKFKARAICGKCGIQVEAEVKHLVAHKEKRDKYVSCLVCSTLGFWQKEEASGQ